MRRKSSERKVGVLPSGGPGRLLAGSPRHRRLTAAVLAGVVAAAWPALGLAFQAAKPKSKEDVRPVAKQPGTDKQIPKTRAKAGEKQGKSLIPEGAKPVIFAADPVYDFGVQWVGPTLKHAFKLENKGDAVLNITKVRPGCGCTIAGTYPKSLAPGESGEFPFSLNSKKLRGKYKKSITITSNDPVNPTFKLTLNGEVKRYVDVKPTTANFGRVAGDEEHERVLTIQNNTESPLEITLPKIGETMKFAFELKETVPGKTFELRIRTKPPHKAGTLRDTLVLSTNIAEQKTVEVRVFATIPERLDVQPRAINIVKPRSKTVGKTGQQPLKRVLRFTNYGKAPVELIEGTVDHPDVTVTITENKKGKKYSIQVQMPPDFDPPPKGYTLTLKTTDKEIPELTIPIRKPPGRTAKREPRPAEKMVGKEAPTFELTTTSGKKLTSADLKDTITVLDFFAPNCPHCKKQIPKIERIRKEYEEKGVRFILVSQTMRKKRFTEEQVTDITKQIGSHVELAMDPDNKVGPLFKATSYPTLVMIGKSGKIDAVSVGNAANLENRMKKQLDAMLAGKPVPQFTASARRKPRTKPALELVGKAAPAFEIQTLAGKVVSNSDLAKHSATVLNFVAPNCGFCKKQVPNVEKVRKEYEAKGVRFVNVMQKMRKEYTQEAAVDVFKGIGSHIELANDMKTNKVGKSFKATSFPTMVLVGKNGTVEAVNIGAKKDLEKTLRSQLDTLIAGKSLVKAGKTAQPSPVAIKQIRLAPSAGAAKNP